MASLRRRKPHSRDELTAAALGQWRRLCGLRRARRLSARIWGTQRRRGGTSIGVPCFGLLASRRWKKWRGAPRVSRRRREAAATGWAFLANSAHEGNRPLGPKQRKARGMASRPNWAWRPEIKEKRIPFSFYFLALVNSFLNNF